MKSGISFNFKVLTFDLNGLIAPNPGSDKKGIVAYCVSIT